MKKGGNEMAKKENRSLIIWALICLAVGLIMGLFLTTVVTTGKAMKALGERANLEEARTNLTLDTLNVNKINNNTTALTINSNPGINLYSRDEIGIKTHAPGSPTEYRASYIKLNPGTNEDPTSTMALYADNLYIGFRLLSFANSYNSDVPALVINGGPNWQDITINAPLKYIATPIVNPVNSYYACIASDGTLFKSITPCR